MHAGFEELIGAELRRLPAQAPPPGAWNAIAMRLDAAAPARPRSPATAARWRVYAAAAALAGVIVVGALLTLHSPLSPAPVMPSAATPSPARGDDVDALQARSQRLERALYRLPPRPAVERVGTSATIDALQTRIQLLDGELNADEDTGGSPARERALWNERVRLLDSLVNVRYAEAVRVDYRTTDERVTYR
jgi:hypothetical protein